MLYVNHAQKNKFVKYLLFPFHYLPLIVSFPQAKPIVASFSHVNQGGFMRKFSLTKYAAEYFGGELTGPESSCAPMVT
jgi:hypothetical protein